MPASFPANMLEIIIRPIWESLTDSDSSGPALKAKAMVLVDIQPSRHRSPDGKGYIIAAIVTLTNPGGQNTTVTWRDKHPPFAVRLATFNDAGEAEFAPPKELRVLRTKDPTLEASSHVVRAGGIESMSFALQSLGPPSLLFVVSSSCR